MMALALDEKIEHDARVDVPPAIQRKAQLQIDSPRLPQGGSFKLGAIGSAISQYLHPPSLRLS